MQTATGSAIHPETLDIATPDHYQAHGYPHSEWAWLRANEPVFWYDRENFNPFWAITKHDDIVWIGRQPKLFLNAPRMAVFQKEVVETLEDEARHLLNMDPPDHAMYRRVTSGWFTPRAVQRMEGRVARVTSNVLDAAAEKSEGDFVGDISAKITIAVVAEMLGVPECDWERLFRWTNETIAPDDPEFQDGASATETFERARLELFSYFSALAEDRRRTPADDIISVVANGQVAGEPLPIVELLSYYWLLVVAGNETTRNAMTGGMLALLENPGELGKLRAESGLVDCAVEEVVRWTTPVIQFARTAAKNVELRGKRIDEGQSVCLFYPSANRDEEMFEDPFAFRIDRDPNPHIGFGMGEHVCLGSHLARLELREVFGQLRERLVSCEVTGPPERQRSSFVGGIKRAPMRWEITGA